MSAILSESGKSVKLSLIFTIRINPVIQFRISRILSKSPRDKKGLADCQVNRSDKAKF